MSLSVEHFDLKYKDVGLIDIDEFEINLAYYHIPNRYREDIFKLIDITKTQKKVCKYIQFEPRGLETTKFTFPIITKDLIDFNKKGIYLRKKNKYAYIIE